MNYSERAFGALRETPLGKTVEAFNNPRLSDDASSYLDEEHREELRDHSEIVYWDEYAKPEPVAGVGTIYRIAIGTKQGYEYDGAWGVPLKQQTDSLALATSPLGTSANGFNRHMMLNYMRAGNFVGFLAGEGSYDSGAQRHVRTRISLANSAAALLNYGYHLSHELKAAGHDVDLRRRSVFGASRSGGIALIMNTLDEDFDQDLRVTDTIAPSPALKFESTRHWLKLAEQVAREPLKTTRIIGHLGLDLAMHYRKTVDFNLASLAHQLEICGPVFNGELDAAMTHMPADKVIRISEYEHDYVCNDGGLEEKLSTRTHPNIRFEEFPGIHMSIADRRITLPIMIGLNKAYQEQEDGVSRIDADRLFARAKELAPRQFPITAEQVPKPYELAS